MIMDLDTRKLKLKKNELLMFNGKTISAISRTDLIKPLLEELAALNKRVRDLEIDNEMLKQDVQGLKLAEELL